MWLLWANGTGRFQDGWPMLTKRGSRSDIQVDNTLNLSIFRLGLMDWFFGRKLSYQRIETWQKTLRWYIHAIIYIYIYHIWHQNSQPSWSPFGFLASSISASCGGWLAASASSKGYGFERWDFNDCKLVCEKYKRPTFPETNIAPENWWLEDYFPFEQAYFQGLC